MQSVVSPPRTRKGRGFLGAMQTERTCSSGAERLLNTIYPALDLGFVQPIDYMGSDNDIVQAARVSYGPSPKAKHDDRGLLRYLMRHRHTSPFEMCEVKFRCKMPIFVARQWIRHRTANVNEMSLRYTQAPDEFYLPAPTLIAVQSKDNKQGRGQELDADTAARVLRLLREGQESAYEAYQILADGLGVSRELARAALPVSIYTQWVWKIDLHNLFHFLALRLHPHAQAEIRVFAEAMAEFVKSWVPLAWEAFEDYRLHAETFSRQERQVLASALGRAAYDCLEEEALEAFDNTRERKEFLAKINRLRALNV